jgi:hypothetical protein
MGPIGEVNSSDKHAAVLDDELLPRFWQRGLAEQSVKPSLKRALRDRGAYGAFG